ncbi:HAMP domain-containing protein [Paractinoplanes maris]|uniref:HAMP domain-containing protein n=1 Tax=Paractinoplanes maris TaxID=1734446 RepID=UPI0020213D6C|nr:methyl-accepting chemotaxis protein [Actinoplanes maris]
MAALRIPLARLAEVTVQSPAAQQHIAEARSRCVRALKRVGTGDLTVRVQVDSADEVGEMARTLNQTAEAMAGTVGRVHANSDLLASASEELSSVSSQLAASAEQTSAQVTTVSQSAGQVSEGVQAVAAGAEEMGLSIREISNSANEAGRPPTWPARRPTCRARWRPTSFRKRGPRPRRAR